MAANDEVSRPTHAVETPAVVVSKQVEQVQDEDSEVNIHECPSSASFRTATPDSSFGHPLDQAPRPLTKDPGLLKKVFSSVSLHSSAADSEIDNKETSKDSASDEDIISDKEEVDYHDAEAVESKYARDKVETVVVAQPEGQQNQDGEVSTIASTILIGFPLIVGVVAGRLLLSYVLCLYGWDRFGCNTYRALQMMLSVFFKGADGGEWAMWLYLIPLGYALHRLGYGRPVVRAD